MTQLYNLGHVLSAYRSATATAEQMSWALGSAERRSVYFHCIMTAYELRDTSKLTEYPRHETRVLTESLQPFLFRDIFGNPFRPAVVAPNWRTDTVRAMAQQMYESRDFSAMPILADALQDAGCDNDEVLAHCRSSAASHARGCCVVDAVLGKE